LVLALVAPFGGGPGAGRLGMALILACGVEIAVGAVMLRPALVGQGPAFHAAVRPFRVAMHGRSVGEPTDDDQPEGDAAWRAVVGDLLDAEFRFQIEPERAELSRVFVADTPVHRQAVAHHANLARSGLRIVGRGPRLVVLRVIHNRSPTILAVTVDHPGRQLLDGAGNVVGVRRPERRSGRLWLAVGPDGDYRIAESVERGAVSLDGEPGPGDEQPGDPAGVVDTEPRESSPSPAG
jgi:hypothetical protein